MLSSYLLVAGFYLLAIGYYTKLGGSVYHNAGWVFDVLAMLGFGCVALLLTGGLLPGAYTCPVGTITSKFALWGQCVGVGSGFLSLLTTKK